MTVLLHSDKEGRGEGEGHREGGEGEGQGDGKEEETLRNYLYSMVIKENSTT